MATYEWQAKYGAVDNASGIVSKMSSNISNSNKKTQSSFSKMATFATKSGRQVTSVFGQMSTAAMASGVAIAAFGIKSISETSMRIDSFKNAMIVATGSVAGANEKWAESVKMAQTLGIPLANITDSYGKFAIAASGAGVEVKQIDEIFASFSKSSVALGLSQDQTNLIFKATEQMFSKGQVYAEELRGQLGEQLPGAFQMSAKAMGVTNQQFDKMLQNGEVLAKDLLPKLAKLMNNEYSTAFEASTSKMRFSINNMKTAWTNLVSSVANAGFYDVIKVVVDNITTRLDLLTTWFKGNGKQALRTFFDDMSKAFTVVINSIDQLPIYLDLALAHFAVFKSKLQLESGDGWITTALMRGLTGYDSFLGLFKGNLKEFSEAMKKAIDPSQLGKGKDVEVGFVVNQDEQNYLMSLQLREEAEERLAIKKIEVAKKVGQVSMAINQRTYKEMLEEQTGVFDREDALNKKKAEAAKVAAQAAAKAKEIAWMDAELNIASYAQSQMEKTADKRIKEEKRIAKELESIKSANSRLFKDTVKETDALKEKYATELSLVESRYSEESIILETAYQNQLVSYQEYLDMKKKMDDEYTASKGEAVAKDSEFSKWYYSQEGQLREKQVSFASDTFGKLASMQNTESKKGFENAKALNAAQAVMSTYQAIAKTMADPSLPFPTNVVMSGIIGAMGAMQVSQIKSQTFQPRMAGGNVFKGQEYVVGERGKELFVPNANGRILNDSQMDSVTGEVKNTTVNESKNINFNIQATDGQDVARMLTDQKDLIVNLVRRGMA